MLHLISGYHFKYPFLSSDCGIYVDNEFVQPLYKHIINAEHPTMAFLGITYIHDHDLQVILSNELCRIIIISIIF